MSRKREREGKHESVGGKAADEVLESVVQQFADRYAFVRELVQNSLDAGTARIEVRMTYDGRELRVEVQDDGEGMDRAIIEGYLLVLFRSTKEEDLTKIGKFGIGFKSIFAMEPIEVIVDTGRDAVWHRVVFDDKWNYTLSRLNDPYEGTTVTLRIPASSKQASNHVVKIRESLRRWCRYADAEIVHSATGTKEEWDETVLREAFDVDAPVVVREETDGFVAVMGPSATPRAGFYNRGITLFETDEGPIPGVTFKVAGRHLEHTLTRDNVIRDRHYDAVIERLEDVARTKLAEAVHAEAEEAAAAGDLSRVKELFSTIAGVVPWEWEEGRRIFPEPPPALRATSPTLRAGEEEPALPPPPGSDPQRDPEPPSALRATSPTPSRGGGGPASSLQTLRGGLWARLTGAQIVWWSQAGELGAAVRTAGTPVVLAESEQDRHLLLAAELVQGTIRPVAEEWWLAEPAEVSAALVAIFEAAAALRGAPVLAVRWAGGEALAGRLAMTQAAPFSLGRGALPAASLGHPLLVDVGHSLVATIEGVPVALAGPLLLYAAHADTGLATAVPPDLEAALGRALAVP